MARPAHDALHDESGLEAEDPDHLRFTGRFKVSELAAAFNERS